MSKRTRDQLKKKGGQIYNHYDKVNLQLIELHKMFNEPHPELATALQVCVQTNIVAEQIFAEFTKECGWGDKETLLKYISKAK